MTPPTNPSPIDKPVCPHCCVNDHVTARGDGLWCALCDYEFAPPVAQGAETSVYRGYTITHDTKLPTGFQWEYCHVNYDGPGDERFGREATHQAARDRIDELEGEPSPPPTGTNTPDTDSAMFCIGCGAGGNGTPQDVVDVALSRHLESQRNHWRGLCGLKDEEIQRLTAERDQLRRERDEQAKCAWMLGATLHSIGATIQEHHTATDPEWRINAKITEYHHRVRDLIRSLRTTLADTQRQLAQLRHEKEQADSPMFSRRELLGLMAEAQEQLSDALLAYDEAGLAIDADKARDIYRRLKAATTRAQKPDSQSEA